MNDNTVLDGYPCQTSEPITCRDADATEKPNYDDIAKAHREDSIVRNPCLPRRFKKGSKRF